MSRDDPGLDQVEIFSPSAMQNWSRHSYGAGPPTNRTASPIASDTVGQVLAVTLRLRGAPAEGQAAARRLEIGVRHLAPIALPTRLETSCT